MKTIFGIFATLLFVFALCMPVSASAAAPGGPEAMAEPEEGVEAPAPAGDESRCAVEDEYGKCVMRGGGCCCGPGCNCEMRMKGGMTGGVPGMRGDFDDMTWPPMQKSCRMPDYYLRMRGELSLSAFQVEKLKKLLSSMKKTAITKGAAVKVLEMELSDIVKAPDFAVDDAVSKLKEVEAARTDLRAAMIKVSAEARDVLSKEQIETLKSMDNDAAPMGGPETRMRKMMMERMKDRMMQ